MQQQAFEVVDLGRMSYAKALEIQEARFNAILESKRQNQPHSLNALYLVEHDPVYTLGKSGDSSNLIQNPEAIGATFFHSSRGGDITYHGPGQIVGYPIFDLEQFDMGIAKYIWSLEEAIIKVIAEFGLTGSRISDASGVWLEADTPHVRKVCAIGVKASRYVTMHGFAFNVNTDLSYFNHIIPCGIPDKGVTSLERELGQQMDYELMKIKTAEAFARLFQMSS